jgi:hypothetical protein
LRWSFWIVGLVVIGLAGGCGGSDDRSASDGGTDTDTDTDVDSDTDSDSDTDTDTDTDECVGYRTEYPSGPYGTSLGDVLADFTGMVDGDANPHDMFEIYQDPSVVALAIANAYDT